MQPITLLDPRAKKPGNHYPESTIKTMHIPPHIFLPFTGSNPEVTLDKKEGTVFILGRCCSHNPHSFFMPLMQWASDYEKNPQPVTTVIINTDYINTGSILALRQFLGILANVQFAGHKIIIKWYCDKDDDDTLDTITLIEEIIKVKIHIEVAE